MGLVIKNNKSATNALNTLKKNKTALAKSLAKVSSGMRINSAGDDASGYSISERMRVEVRGLDQDVRNTQNGISMLRTAEGAVSSTVDILKTLKEKALDAANDTNTDIDRATIQKEIDQAIDQVDDNSQVTFNGKYLLNIPGNASGVGPIESVSDFLIRGLNSEWLKDSLDLIQQSYATTFGQPTTKINRITVYMDETEPANLSNALAFVRSFYSVPSGDVAKLELHVNMDYFKNMSTTDPNGNSLRPEAGYLDRVITHEMTHAIMAANVKTFRSLPDYLVEGMAELVHGIDDFRGYTIRSLTKDNFKDALDAKPIMSKDNIKLTDTAYAAGYVLWRYVAKNGASSDAATNMKTFMDVLRTSTSNDGNAVVNEAINAATGGKFATMDAAINSLINDLGNSSSLDDFLLNSCNIILTNADTGSITGSDAGSGQTKTAESVVPETTDPSVWTSPDGKLTVIDDLEIEWPEDFVGLSKNGRKRLNNFLLLQVGTKSNQAIRVFTFDMRAKSLGLRSSTGENISVATRDKAMQSIDLIDKAVEKALDTQTTIGAMESRLEYTATNLTTASENVQSSESTIRDADMAKEMTEYTKNNVLLSTAQSILAQANQNSSSVLSLLQ